MLRILSLLIILLTAIALSDQLALVDKRIDDKQLAQRSYQQDIDQEDEDYPSCQRNCTELNPETAIQNCPTLRRGLSCGKYVIYHYHRRCSVATVYCQRNMTNVREVAVYVAVVGTELNANKSGLFVLPYLDKSELSVPQVVVEKAHHGDGNMGELVCDSSGSWVLYDTNYRYMIEHLFCLVVEARNLNYLLDLRRPEFDRAESSVPYQQGSLEFFEQRKF
ncbi:unnamed protein product [Litomosoides sigmodontis]|uniref:Uncharacterized protein n=1 Tax=Litomosoides sigmodontis TaxID=42156 RepID=A0A3P6UQP7_LITSI|nr:unnamed protein product [Litomosoides sigmodontis]